MLLTSISFDFRLGGSELPAAQAPATCGPEAAPARGGVALARLLELAKDVNFLEKQGRIDYSLLPHRPDFCARSLELGSVCIS